MGLLDTRGATEVTIIAERLRLYRGLRGMSQRRLADKSGVVQSTVWRIEQGTQVPSAPTLQALAEALDVPFGALLGTELYVPPKEER